MSYYMLLIFDLDGTLFQAKAVVLRAAERLLDEMGAPPQDESSILKNAGQGIDALLRNILPGNATPDAARTRILELMREAIFDYGELFPGVYEAVIELHSEGHDLVLCSNSPEEYIKTVLEFTDIEYAFSRYYSVNAYPSKSDLVAELIKTDTSAIVIGDTHGDIEAAHNNDLPAIAAMYGYGNKTMLEAAEYKASSPEDIVKCIHRALGVEPNPPPCS